MRTSITFFLIVFFSFTSLFAVRSDASDRQQIRFYKANKLQQTNRIWFNSRKAKKAGCHNFYKRTRVYQANQYGFAHCSLFSAKNCKADSVIEVNRKKDETAQTQLSEGFSWFPITDHVKGVKLRSWSCEGISIRRTQQEK